MFEDKINGENQSGAMRMEASLGLQELYESFTLPNWIFGIGFGNAYLGIFDGLLVNTGLIGLGVFIWTLGRPAWSLPTAPGYEGLKAGILSILILSRLSLSELFLPTTWMFVGLAWYYLSEYQRTRVPAPMAISWPASPAPSPTQREETALEATTKQPLPPRRG
jgi:hypothetical protein